MTRNRTVYTVTVAGTDFATRTEKAAALRVAEGVVTAEQDKLVTVTTGAGTEVYRHEPVVTEPEASAEARPHFSPWTRVDDAAFVELLEVPANYEVAYVRRRINAAAARHTGREGWVILQLQADGTTVRHDAVNTKHGQEIFNELRAEQLRQREAARLAAEAAKAEAEKEVTPAE